MRSAEVQQIGCMEYAVASRTFKGEAVSGDAYFVERFDGGILLAVVDGAGHGVAATAAARAAIDVLGKHSEESVLQLMQRCHKELQATRGAAMTIVSVRTEQNVLEWIGVGNVEGYCCRARLGNKAQMEGVVLRGGIVGYQLPPLRAASLKIARGDTLILATDGIRPLFSAALKLHDSPQTIADDILKGFLKGTDDGLILVARFNGREHV
jgi:negative regulator of sigma-B (phosphoserine phosphatase)